MNPKITKLIDQYLSGTLEGEDKIAFERELVESIELQQEVELQRSVMQAAKRASQRREVKEAAKRYRRKNLLRTGGISALVTVIIASTVFFLANLNSGKDANEVNELPPISAETRDKLDTYQDFENVPIQYFQIPAQGMVHLSEQGVLISVPKGAFLKDGSPYMGNVILQYQEAIRGVDIIKSGLSTMTGDELLETQGMFSVTGYTEDGEALHFNPEVGVYLQAPVDDCVSDMQLYDGEKKDDGSIDWVNPEPLSKIPVIVKMSDLDFYPAGYEKHLDKEKWKRDKASRDSLYLSLEHTLDVELVSIEKTSTSQVVNYKEQEMVTLQKDMGQVFRKREKKTANLPGIDESISWSINKKLLGNGVWEIEAKGLIAEGYYIPTLDDLDSNLRTELKITTIKGVSVVEKPSTKSPIRTIRTQNGTVKGHTDSIEITAKVKVLPSFRKRVPVRAVFKLSNKDFAYSKVFRGTDLSLRESTVERKMRMDSLANVEMLGDYILPSKVLSFWKPAFNNTLLSTREFERRMQVIHKLCDNKLLDLYVRNLNQPMVDLDRKAVQLGYSEFSDFVSENVGAVDIDKPHVKLLTEFYEKSSKLLREDAKSKTLSEASRMKQWQKILQAQEQKDKERTVVRNEQFVNNMGNFTRKNLVRQFNNTQGFTINTGSSGDRRRARKNIDALRPYAALRNINDLTPYAGMTSLSDPGAQQSRRQTKVLREKIDYKELTVSVKNLDNYEDVYLYLYADDINSYQRVERDSAGVFKCLLNEKIDYAIGIIGITKNGFSYFERNFAKAGNLGTVKLNKIDASELEAKIHKMNADRLPSFNTKGELDWLRTKRKNYQVKGVYKEMIEFRREVKEVIFPCATFRRKESVSTINGTSENSPELQAVDNTVVSGKAVIE
ncbi:MAG: hypothetical protein NXI10_03210 [bacterium]|nr:hypothetical protein [bacterium]